MKLTFGTKTKRFFCFILSSLMLLSLCCTVFFAAGCSRETASGDEQAFTLFMNSIRNGQFTEAFSFISAHVAPENAVDDSIEAYKNTITLAQFEKRYESLFSLLGVSAVYGAVMSEGGRDYLESKGIRAEYGVLVPQIINRAGNGVCPMEQAVSCTEDALEGCKRIKERMAQLRAAAEEV